MHVSNTEDLKGSIQDFAENEEVFNGEEVLETKYACEFH
jgi:hypothetical protein